MKWSPSCWAYAMSCDAPGNWLRLRPPPPRRRKAPPPRAMYNVFRNACERVLRIPADPEIPPGDEHSTRFFRAAPNFYRYLFFIWLLGTVLLSVLSLFIVGGPIAVAVIESR